MHHLPMHHPLTLDTENHFVPSPLFLSCSETNDITLYTASLGDGNRSSATVSFHLDTADPFWACTWYYTMKSHPSPLCWDYSQIVHTDPLQRKKKKPAELLTCFESKPLIQHQGKEWPKMVEEKQAIEKEWVKNANFSVFIIRLLWSTSVKGTEIDHNSDSFH